MTKAFVASRESFSREHEIPVVQFRKGQRKDDIMRENLARCGKPEGVVFIGKAQEKTPVFRTEKRAAIRKRATLIRGLCARRRW